MRRDAEGCNSKVPIIQTTFPCVERKGGHWKWKRVKDKEQNEEVKFLNKGSVGLKRRVEASWELTNGKADWGVTQYSERERERGMFNTLYVSLLHLLSLFPNMQRISNPSPPLLTHTQGVDRLRMETMSTVLLPDSREREMIHRRKISSCALTQVILFFSIRIDSRKGTM